MDRSREGIVLTLHHAALPKLDETGLVEYDARSRLARYRGHPLLEDVLRLVAEGTATS